LSGLGSLTELNCRYNKLTDAARSRARAQIPSGCSSSF